MSNQNHQIVTTQTAIIQSNNPSKSNKVHQEYNRKSKSNKPTKQKSNVNQINNSIQAMLIPLNRIPITHNHTKQSTETAQINPKNNKTDNEPSKPQSINGKVKTNTITNPSNKPQ